MTLPGVDFTVAESISRRLGDVSRFATRRQAAAYFGLVPSTYQSGEHCYHGPITKHGRAHARWLLVQAAQHSGRPSRTPRRLLPPFGQEEEPQCGGGGDGAQVSHHCLAHAAQQRTLSLCGTQRPSRPSSTASASGPPASAAKADCGDSRVPSSTARDAPKPLPALAILYAAEQLPALAHPAGGEKRMLDRNQLTEWAAALHLSKRKPKGAATGAAAPAIS